MPDYETIASFFGAKENSTGGYDFIDERLPSGWKNRVEPYTLSDLGENIHRQYMMYKRPIGHNTGRGNFTEDARQFPDDGTATDIICLLYNQVTDNFPGESYSHRWHGNLSMEYELMQLNIGPKVVPIPITNYIKRKINPHFAKVGCNVSEPTLDFGAP